MADSNNTAQTNTASEWTPDTTDFFELRLEELHSILTVLISSVSEHKADAGRASDEAISLAIQHVFAEIDGLKNESRYIRSNIADHLYEHFRHASAISEVLFEIVGEHNSPTFSANVLAGYLSAIRRLLDRASREVNAIHILRFKNRHPQ